MRPLLGILSLTMVACGAPPCPETPAPTPPSPAPAIEPSPVAPVPLPTAAPVRVPPRSDAPDITAWMPVDCRGRFYFDVERLTQGFEGDLEALIMPLIAEQDPRGEAQEALKVLRNGGLDPFRSMRAIAGCERPDMGVVELLGAPSQPLATLLRALLALHEGQPELRSGPPPMLEVGGNDAFLEVAPGVVVFTDDRDDVAPILEERGGMPGFREVADLLVYVQVESVTMTVRDEGGRWFVRFVVEERVRERAEVRRRAREFLARAASHLTSKTPLRRLGAALRRVVVGVHPRGVEIELDLERSTVGDTIRAARGLTADELEDLLEGRAFR